MAGLGKRIMAGGAAAALVGATMIGSTAAADQAAPASAPPVATAKYQTKALKNGPGLKVMTLNLYLGGSLGKAIEAADKGLTEFLTAAAEVYDTAIATDFPLRAKWIAKTIKTQGPDVITLNELSNWVAKAPPSAGLKSQNFLKILQKELRKQGLRYKVAALSQNANLGLSATTGIPYVNPNVKGCETLQLSGGCSVRLKDRDAVLYNTKAKGLKMIKGSGKDGNFTSQLKLAIAGVPLSFDRGWARAGFTYKGKKVTVMTAHLEVESKDGAKGPYGPKNWPSKIQTAQAWEMKKIARMAAKDTEGRVILMGDFNTDANGYYSPAYRNLTRSYFSDSWLQAGGSKSPARNNTCCQKGDLNSSLRMNSGDPALPTRIDLILTHKAKATWAKILARKRMQDQQPRWQSDHYFYGARVNLR